MSIFLILFFTALIGISLILGRRLFLLKKAGMNNEREFGDDDFAFVIPDLEKISGIVGKELKKVGYITFVSGLRIYMLSFNFLKNKYKNLKVKIRDIKSKNNIGTQIIKRKKQEASKFLKVVSEYKTKIKKIKRKIKEEEGLN